MLPILKLGSTGPLVSQGQTFPRGQGLAVDASGLFWGGHFSRRDGMHFELAVVP